MQCSSLHVSFARLPLRREHAPGCTLPDPARRHASVRCRSQAVGAPTQTARRFPDFVPAEVAGIQEVAALELVARLERLPVSVPSLSRQVDTALIAPASSSRSPSGAAAVFQKAVNTDSGHRPACTMQHCRCRSPHLCTTMSHDMVIEACERSASALLCLIA